MPLNKLDNFIKNIEGRILYVNPNDLDATDSISNQGNSLAQPFKTIQRALLEAGRFSYVRGNDNDLIEKTTILLFPGEHVIDNRPGWAIYDNGGAKAVNRAGVESLASSVFSLELNSVFDLNQEDNILYKFNSYYGGVVVPRGTSIVGLDLRKTKIRAKYVPNPTDDTVNKSAIFRLTGTCYLWQFSLFDADPSGLVYTHPDFSSQTYQATPLFSHHKLTCFEYCDGVNKIGSFGLTDLDMYYSKVSNAYNSYREIEPEDKYPTNLSGFAKRRPEWEIVGAFAPDPIEISSIIAGNGSSATNVITVTTEVPHELNAGTPIKIRGVSGSGVTQPYNISTFVQNVLTSTSFTYILPSIASYPNINPAPSAAGATVTVETDTVTGASPYIFNISLRSIWGMNGMHADGSKASGFKSMVVAQFTGVSLQKDDRAFVKYNQQSRTYESVDYTAVYGSSLTNGASQTDPNKIYHLDANAIYRSGWETSHIKISNDSFIQVVSVFAIGYTKHFDVESGGDASITNSNSNFGQISLNSAGFKKEAFDKDNNAFITSIVAPRAIDTTEEDIEWLSIDVGLTTQVGVSSHLYLYGFTASDAPPTEVTQGYRIGARSNDVLYIVNNGSVYSASIYMCDNAIASSGFTTARGTTSSVKLYDVTSGPSANSFTIGSNNLITGEKIKLISDDGDLPENIEPHRTYYVIKDGANAIKLASSYTNATQNEEITVYGGTNLHVLSRVSEKAAGDLGSPIQYDPQNGWFIHVNANNDIYNAFDLGGIAEFTPNTDLAYVKRVIDDRSLDEKLYKLRVVIPKELSNGKDPEAGFVIQESSTTGVGSSAEFTVSTITNTDYEYNKNRRFISTCSESAGTVTVLSELPHHLQTSDIVVIKNVKSSTNLTAVDNEGYNGRFEVTSISDAFTFQYSTTDIAGVTHTVGIFTNTTSTRNENLPRFERNDWQSNLFIYRNEVISPYIYNQQDGIYHLYVLNANNKIPTEFTDLKYGQLPADLYPQLDRDNFDPNPLSAKTYAKRSPIGGVITNDLKKSITRETTDLALKTIGIGLTISSVTSTSGIATITFSRFHGLSGIVTGTRTAGASYTNGTYYNVKLLNGSQTGTWNGATAKVVVSSGQVSSVDIMSPGSGYSAEALYFDQTKIGAGNGAARYTIATSGISTNIGDVVQVTGIGTIADQYYRISSVPSSTSVAIAKTAGDLPIIPGQYVFVVGPSVKVNSSAFDDISGVTQFITDSAHGLLSGNRFTLIDSNNSKSTYGEYIVKERVGVTTFTVQTADPDPNGSGSAITSLNLNGHILKHGLSSNEAISDERAENFGVRGVPFYDNERFKLTTAVTTGTTINFATYTGIGTGLRLPLGSYVQIDHEIMRVVSSNSNSSATVIRGVLGTLQESHDQNSLIRKINPIAIEFRRPSIIRASGHTFEYLGYGPGNYSTSLPQVQITNLTDEEGFLAQSQERSCGTVVYTGMNNNGDFFSGNTKTSSVSGETISFDIPNPTVTGEDPNKLSVVYDEVTVKERLLVEGGKSNIVLSQFNGPVNFNKNIRVKDKAVFNKQVRLTEGAESYSTVTGDLLIAGGSGIGKNVNIGGRLNVAGITTVNGLNINTTGIGEGDLGSNGGGDKVFGIYNTTSGGSITINCENSSGTSNSILNVTSGIATVNGNLDVTNNVNVSGITTYEQDVTVQGNLYVGKNGGGDTNIYFYDDSANNYTPTIQFVDAASTISSNTVAANTFYFSNRIFVNGQIETNGDITAFSTSDERLKDNITPIEDPLAKILSISGNTFNWNEKSDKEGNDVGVIAQEIAKILPEAVKQRDTGYLAVDYQKLIPLMIEAIKELSDKVKKLEER